MLRKGWPWNAGTFTALGAGTQHVFGPLISGTADHNLLALATDGQNTGLYLIGDANDDDQMTATDIRLLGLFNGNAALGLGDLAFV